VSFWKGLQRIQSLNLPGIINRKEVDTAMLTLYVDSEQARLRRNHAVISAVVVVKKLSLSPPWPSLGLGLLRNLLPLKMAEFLGGFSTIFFFTG